MSWDEIRKSDKHGLGTEKIARNAIKAPILSMLLKMWISLRSDFALRHLWLVIR